ncbi:MAG: hypothetical protein H6707_19130 [Deltaproteobacteria bacterium]|nr:hypothetical protein [Deltaproteobacteria bacterium]
MNRWFDNTSVQPSEPERRYWTRADEDMLLRRLGYADVAVVGSIRVVNAFYMFDSPRQVALAFSPQQVLYGSLKGAIDDDGELFLQLGRSGLDFHLAVTLRRHLPGRRYLLFIKFRPQSAGQRSLGEISGWRASLKRPGKQHPTFSWVLYRPDKALLEQVQTMYGWLK